MGSSGSRRLVAFLLVAGATAACASSGSRLAEGQPCRLDYVRPADRRPAVALTIVNKSWKQAEKDGRSGLSRVEDKMMSALVGDYEGLGFFASAQRDGPSRPGGYLALHLPDGVWFLSQPGADQRAQWEKWQVLLSGFSAVFSEGETVFTVNQNEFVDCARRPGSGARARARAMIGGAG
jgi:hypothetical protein